MLFRTQATRFILANGCTYTPDFEAIRVDGRKVFYEVKGFMRDDALVKIKVVAEQRPEYEFVLVFWREKQWHFKPVTP